MVTVALVPARGGSKGLPAKNLASVRGRSLVALAIGTALQVPAIDEVVVSSDDAEILAEAERSGAAGLRRPRKLATDTATARAVIDDFLRRRPDVSVLVLLQPTSPLRRPEDVLRCLDALTRAAVAVTVSPLDYPAGWLFDLGSCDDLVPLFGWESVVDRRQDAPPVYALNGAVYAARADHLRTGGQLVGPGTVGVVMPRERSVDVDDHVGLVLARVLAGDIPVTGRA